MFKLTKHVQSILYTRSRPKQFMDQPKGKYSETYTAHTKKDIARPVCTKMAFFTEPIF